MALPRSVEAVADFAALVPRITGTISAISSSLIVYLVFRSEAKLNTIYHRIMFGMSVADILSSTAIALTTLPMPRNDDPWWTEDPWMSKHYGGEVFWEEQTKIGNRQTCAAQGFCFSTGVIVMFSYNGMLFVYYACAIALRMKEEKIRKRIQPFIIGVPVIQGLCSAVPALIYGHYNPIRNEAWCTLYPIGDFPVYGKWFGLLLNLNCLIIGAEIMISFALIIWRVLQNGRTLARADDNRQKGMLHQHIHQRVRSAHHNSKLIIVQSLAYVGAFFLTISFPLIRNLCGDDKHCLSDAEVQFLNKLTMTFMPLQGFFNFVIFLWHKVANYRRVNTNVSVWKVVRILFKSSSVDEPVLLSRISMLRQDEQNNKIVGEVEIIDEFGTESKLAAYDDLGDDPSDVKSNSTGSAGAADPPSQKIYAGIIVPDTSKMAPLFQKRPPVQVKDEIKIFQDDKDMSSSSRGRSLSEFSMSLFSFSSSPSFEPSSRQSASLSPARTVNWAEGS